MNINVLCPNGRRQPIKVSPNTSILEVLEEACRKQGLKPDAYDIRHYNRSLDLSLSVRFANLPNNAMLELSPTKHIRQEETVTVALQLESGERLTSDFSPSSSLWDVISKCINSRNESTGNEEPVCIYMQQKFIGDKIKTTTLRNLGLTSGKAIIRLMYRPLGSLHEQAHISVPLSKPLHISGDDTESTVQKKVARSELSCDHIAKKQPRLDTEVFESTAKVNTLEEMCKEEEVSCVDEPMQCEESPVTSDIDNDTFKKESENDFEDMDLGKIAENNKKPIKEIGEIKYLGPRNAVLFNLEDILEIKKDDFPDDFFELTIADVRYLMDEYKKTRTEMENEPLLLRRQRENRFLQQLACYKQSVIRVYFPDQLVLQGTFIADESVQSVIDFVRNFLDNPDLAFYLYITPPKTKLAPGKTLLESRLVPAAVVYFGCDVSCTSYLSSDVRNQVSDPRAASLAAAECRKKFSSSESLNQLPSVEDTTEERTEVVSVPPVGSQPNDIHRVRSLNSQAKIPAWFKLGRK